MSLLTELGAIGEKPTKEEVEKSVKLKTDLSLVEDNYSEIIGRLKLLNAGL